METTLRKWGNSPALRLPVALLREADMAGRLQHPDIVQILDSGELQEALDGYKGKVVMIVNTASKCGLTPQYEGLEALYRELKDQGFVVLGFPSNPTAQCVELDFFERVVAITGTSGAFLLVLGGLGSLFALAGMLTLWQLRQAIRQKPKLFATSLAELQQDQASLS